MSRVVLAFGLLLVALGIFGALAPATLLRLSRPLRTRYGLYLAAAIRLAMGSALVLYAPSSRVPVPLTVLGALVFLGGVVTPFIGVDRLEGIVAWWSSRATVFQRAWACLALAFGAFIVWAVAP